MGITSSNTIHISNTIDQCRNCNLQFLKLHMHCCKCKIDYDDRRYGHCDNCHQTYHLNSTKNIICSCDWKHNSLHQRFFSFFSSILTVG